MTGAEDTTSDAPVVLVSHRGPVQFGRDGDERTEERGGGGLVTALSGLIPDLDRALWVCAGLTDEDKVVVAENDGGSFDAGDSDSPVRLRMVVVDDEAHDQFYGIVANPLLWFVQHQLWDTKVSPDLTRREHDAFTSGYVEVNRSFAEAVIEEVEACGGEATVMVHDYHFYLLPELVRSKCPQVFLHHFVHIPWPAAEAWRVLPPSMREAIFNGMLGNDVVAFHTERSARNFVLGCQELLDLPVDLDARSVTVGEHTVVARAYPISIDADDFEARAASDPVAEHREALESTRRDHLLLRVDRTDPSKNIVRGFRAFDLLLRDHPELAGRVSFLALLQPSRQDVEE